MIRRVDVCNDLPHSLHEVDERRSALYKNRLAGTPSVGPPEANAKGGLPRASKGVEWGWRWVDLIVVRNRAGRTGTRWTGSISA